MRRFTPFIGTAMALVAWHLAVVVTNAPLIPTPWESFRAIGKLAQKGLLLKYVVASLFRVTWGYLLAVVLSIPFGILLGMSVRGERAINPFLQVLRPISPLA